MSDGRIYRLHTHYWLHSTHDYLLLWSAMRTTINEKVLDFTASPDATAVEIIRDGAALTGTKLVCGTGGCGACTVLYDDKPVCSCLLPASALDGHSIHTVEHFGSPLHPVQRAFMAHDALQCGFCTPGFIVEGIAFYEQWRATHGIETPTRDDIANGLAGHLCRCGAYVGIYAAMQAACRGDFDTEDTVESPRVEAREKVTGQAVYTVDVTLEGQLEGVLLRSPHPHAKITRIDSSAAQRLPGVHALVDLLPKDHIVTYVGQEILALAATDLRTAHTALSLINIEYEVLPSVVGMEAARDNSATVVYPRFQKPAPNSGEGVLLPGRWDRNIRTPLLNLTANRAGKASALIEAAQQRQDPYLYKATFTTTSQSHTTLEPHAAVAEWRDDGLTVYTSTQGAYRAAQDIARHFNLAAEKVQVICHHVGGGFGAKVGVGMETMAAIHLSRKAKAPVRVVLDRWEEMTVGGYRPAAEIQLGLLSDATGDMQALSAHSYADAGVAVGSQIAVMLGLMYTKSPRALADYDVVNHVAPGKPFRGPGGPLAAWAMEQSVDQIAYQTGIDPITLRRRWDDHTLRNQLYDWVETLPVWRDRGSVGAETGRFRRGVGVAATNWFYFFHSDTHIEISTTPQGIVVRTASQDMGNGSRTVMATAVAEVFGIAPTEVIVQIGESLAPRGPLSAGSRTTVSVYEPTRRAAETVRNQVLQAAIAKWGEATLEEGGIYRHGTLLPWKEVFSHIPAQTATAKRGFDAGLPAMPLAFGADSLRTGRGFSGAVHVTEVEVDTRLGKIRPLRVWAGLAVGHIVVPVLARSQVYGAVIQGLGYALYEQRQVDRQLGLTVTSGLESYRIPGMGDVPEIEVHFLEEGFDHAKGKGVGLSELATLGVAASVGNAVFHATGRRFTHLPILPEHIVGQEHTA